MKTSTKLEGCEDPETVGYQGRCNALNRQGENGERCRKQAGWGTTHVGVGACRLHGGSTRNHAKFAEVEIARREVALWGGRKDVHPATALLELVQWKAAEVEYWRFRVAELAEEDLTYGRTKHEAGVDKGMPVDVVTEEGKPHIAHQMLRAAEQDLAQYAAASLKAGVDERLVQVAQAQAVQLLGVIRQVVADPRLQVSESAPVDVVIADAIREVGHAH